MAGQSLTCKHCNGPTQSKGGTLYCSDKCHLLFYTKIEGDCLVWTGSINRDIGYGVLTRRNRGGKGANRGRISAHRLSYELFVGKLRPGMDICHTCDNRRCLKPEHLFQGTRKDNMQDAVSKGRHHPTYTLRPELITGEANFNAKLDAAKVKQIRAAKRGSEALARYFGISYSTLKRVRSRKLWKHVD